MKPTLFQDVDGVLLVDQPLEGYIRIDYDGKSFWYAPETPGRMAILNTLFKIIWSSHSWHGKENAVLSPVFNLPNDLATLDFTPAPVRPEHDMDPSKLRAIEKHDEPLAIVDDRVGPLVEKWAIDRSCLLVKPESAVGLTEGCFNLLRAFGEMYASGSGKHLLSEFGYMGKFATDVHKDRKVAWLRLHGRNETLLDAAVRRFLTAQSASILERLKTGLDQGRNPSADEVFEPRDWDAALLRAVAPHLLRCAAAGAVSALRAAQSQKNALDEFLLALPPSAIERIRQGLSESLSKPYWAGINDTTKTRLSDALVTSYVGGESPRETTARVRQAIAGTALENHSRMISRSETTGALNLGNAAAIEELKQQGLATGSEWLAIRDEHTRHTHVEADGQKSDLNGLFRIGGHPAKYPGDPDLPAEERVHCRCTLVASLVHSRGIESPHRKRIAVMT